MKNKAEAKADRYKEAVVSLLFQNDDIALLRPLGERLLKEAQLRERPTVVISAIPLTDQQKDDLRASLEEDEIDFKVEANILGGLIVEQNGKRLDLSVKGKLTL